MKNITILILIILHSGLFAQSFLTPKTIDDYNFIGKVKRVDYVNYVENLESGELEIEESFITGNIYPSKYLCFDFEGNETVSTFVGIGSGDYSEAEYAIIEYQDNKAIKTIIYADYNDTICIGTYELNNNRIPIKALWIYPDKNTSYESKYTYSDNGLLLEAEYYTPKNIEPNVMEYTRCIYSYDKNNKLVREAFSNAFNEITQIKTHTYNEKNKIIETQFSTPMDSIEEVIVDVSMKVDYDKKENICARYVREQEGYVLESEIAYNRNKTVKKLKFYDNNGDCSIVKNWYRKGKLRKMLMKLPNGETSYLLSYKYDKYGNVTNSSMIYDKSPQDNLISNFEYEYDSIGNWVLRKEMSDGKIKLMTKRKIAYFR